MTYNYVGTTNSNLICCICRMPFVEPTTTQTCAHTFCRACIVRAVRLTPQCPIDRSPLTPDDLQPANPIVRSLVDELIVECHHSRAGCTFTCQRQLLAAHLKDTCEYTEVSCSEEECGQLVLRKDAGSHSHKCVHRVRECDGCKAQVKAMNMESHYAVCPQKTASCTACSSVFSRSELTVHTSTCPDLVIPCLHNANGCPWTGPRRHLLSTHIPSCPYESIKEFFSLNDARMSAVTEANVILKAKVEALEGLVQSMKREMHAVKTVLGPWYRTEEIQHPLSSQTIGNEMARAQASFSRRYSLVPDGVDPPTSHDTFSSPPPNSDTDVLAPYFPPEADQSPHFPQSGTQPPRRATHRPSASLSHFDLNLLHAHQLHQLHLHTPSRPTSIPPINLNTTLEGSFNGLHDSIVTLSASVDSLARQHDIALANETMKLNEEVMGLRASVNGLRMQVHTIMMDRNAQVTGHMNEPSSVWNDGRGGTPEGGWRYYGHYLHPPFQTHPPAAPSITKL